MLQVPTIEFPFPKISGNFGETIDSYRLQKASSPIPGRAKTSAVMSKHCLTVRSTMMKHRKEILFSPVPLGFGSEFDSKEQMVYAIGQLGTDFGTQECQDSFIRAMVPGMSLLDYLNKNPYKAQSLIWTLSLGTKPIYAILPTGPYASLNYKRLRSYLGNSNGSGISVPGHIRGSVKLMSGQIVPVIVPEIQGVYGWSVANLVQSAMQQPTVSEPFTEEQLHSQIESYFNRIYNDYGNLGITPEERAINFCVTNAFEVSVIIANATSGERVLDYISVEKSPICSPYLDCYEVRLSFCYPEDSQSSRRIFRFTVDVSDVIPVIIGDVRSWY